MNKNKLSIGIFAAVMAMSLAATFAFAEDNRGFGSDKEMKVKEKLRVAGAMRELLIHEDGRARVRGLEVLSKSGTQIMAESTWGSFSMKWTLNVNANTPMIRRFGGASSLSEINIGDILSAAGKIDPTASTLTLNDVTIIRNWSTHDSRSMSGLVSSVNATEKNSFVLKSGNAAVTVKTNDSTEIMKNGTRATFADITVGATVRVKGVMNVNQNALMADRVEIGNLISTNDSAKRIFEGKVKSVDNVTGKVIVTIDGKDFTVNVANKTSILNKFWGRGEKSQIQTGDSVRVYGEVKADATIDAEVFRNTSK